MSVGPGLRFEVLRRDNFTCRYCGASAPEVKLEVDHVVPRALGGSDKPWNLVASCETCNRGKAATDPARPLLSGPSEEAIRSVRAARSVIDHLWGCLPGPIDNPDYRAQLANRFVDEYEEEDDPYADFSLWSRDLKAFAQGVHDAADLADHALSTPHSILGALTDVARARWIEYSRREFAVHGYLDATERHIEEFALRQALRAYAQTAGEARNPEPVGGVW